MRRNCAADQNERRALDMRGGDLRGDIGKRAAQEEFLEGELALG